jgi:YVTN family beta-propeller protein
LNKLNIKNAFGGSWILLFLVFFACKKPIEDASPQLPDSFLDGYFVVCEGTYGSGNASISYVDPFSKKTYSDIYLTKNQKPLGDQAQSMHIFNDKGYVVVQNSQKIVVVDIHNFSHLAEIRSNEYLNSPRYFQSINYTKAYVSDWKSDGLAILDLQQNAVAGFIPTGNDPNQMLKTGTLIWVANSGYSTINGKSKIVSIIDTETDKVIKQITLGERPMSFVKDKNNHVWVLCRGFFEYKSNGDIDTSLSHKSEIYQINPTDYSIEKRLSFPWISNANFQPSSLQIDGNGEILFYTYGGKVFKMNIEASSLPQNPLIERDFYGLSFDKANGYLIGCEASTFTSSGKTIRYKVANGFTVIDSAAVGVIPNAVVEK